MMKKVLAVLLVVLSAFCCLAGCGKKPVENNEAHYLIFMVETTEVAKMLVVSTDSFESLEPYFPTVPEKEGFIGYWEDIDEVYSSTKREIYINAYYIKQ